MNICAVCEKNDLQVSITTKKILNTGKKGDSSNGFFFSPISFFLKRFMTLYAPKAAPWVNLMLWILKLVPFNICLKEALVKMIQ